jgi:hypothetical protein
MSQCVVVELCWVFVCIAQVAGENNMVMQATSAVVNFNISGMGGNRKRTCDVAFGEEDMPKAPLPSYKRLRVDGSSYWNWHRAKSPYNPTDYTPCHAFEHGLRHWSTSYLQWELRERSRRVLWGGLSTSG